MNVHNDIYNMPFQNSEFSFCATFKLFKTDLIYFKTHSWSYCACYNNIEPVFIFNPPCPLLLYNIIINPLFFNLIIQTLGSILVCNPHFLN